MSNLTTAERNKLPDADFGDLSDPKDRKYPIVDQEDVDSAAHLIGFADDKADVKARIIAIAKKKGLTIPAAWSEKTETKSLGDDGMVFCGGAVKALGDGRFEAPLVHFGGPSDTDLTNDFFTAETNYWTDFPGKAVLLYEHGFDDTIKAKPLGMGKADLELRTGGDDAGIWLKGQLNIADRYESAIYKMIEAGKIGTSSGSVTHLVAKKSVGGASHVTSWPIFEASLTPKPVESRSFGKVAAIKSLPPAKSFKSLLEEMAGLEDEAQPPTVEPPDPPAKMDSEPSAAIIESLKSLPFHAFLQTMGAVAAEGSRRLSWYDSERSEKQGRAISADNLAAMKSIHEDMSSQVESIKAIIEKHDKPTAEPVENGDALDSLHMDFLLMQAQCTTALQL